jgi:hypothetical protein
MIFFMYLAEENSSVATFLPILERLANTYSLGALSEGPVVQDANCHKWPQGELSMGSIVIGQAIHGTSCYGGVLS